MTRISRPPKRRRNCGQAPRGSLAVLPLSFHLREDATSTPRAAPSPSSPRELPSPSRATATAPSPRNRARSEPKAVRPRSGRAMTQPSAAPHLGHLLALGQALVHRRAVIHLHFHDAAIGPLRAAIRHGWVTTSPECPHQSLASDRSVTRSQPHTDSAEAEIQRRKQLRHLRGQPCLVEPDLFRTGTAVNT